MCCLTRRVEDPLCHPLAIANVGISMQCYQGMNGLNGDRFVTGTLTRPFSRPGQMNQCNSLICFNVWDFTSARSPFLKEAYPGDWRVCLREGFSNPKTHTHTISHYSASSLMTRFWYVMVCLYVQWKLKQRNGTGGGIFQPPPACNSVTMVCTCHNCFKTKLLLSRVTCSRQPQSLVPSPDRSEAQSAWTAWNIMEGAELVA